MINKKMYLLIFIMLLSLLSLSIFSSTNLTQKSSKVIVEYAEKESKKEIEIEDFSHQITDLNFAKSQPQLNFIYKEKIYDLHFSNNLLRPPIFL